MSSPAPSGPFDREDKPPDAPERTPANPQPDEDAQISAEIPEDIQKALRFLMQNASKDADYGRRGYVKQILEAEEFWKNNQYAVWSENEFNYKSPWDFAVANKIDEQPIYQYVLNIYQSSGLTVIAAMSQKVPKVRFFPHSAKSEVDIATARAASDIAELVEKNNNLRLMAIRESYLLWTQGGFLTYTRYVRDEKKGIEELPIVEPSNVQISEDSYLCQACGYEIPVGEVTPEVAVDEIGVESEMMSCPHCGAPISDADFIPGETAEVPVVSGYEQVPEGYEKVSVYGLLNVKIPTTIQNFEDGGYCQIEEEVHEASLRAAHPTKRKEIGHSTNMNYSESAASTSDSFERNARMQLFDAPPRYGAQRSSIALGFLTYRRTWFRRWYFYAHPDPDMQDKLLEMFPDGCYVAFADDVFLEARNENMDDHLTFCSAMPGYGIYPQAIGASTIPLQKQINDAANIVAEHLDFGSAPPIFTDSEFINSEALGKQKMRPGTFMPIARARGGMAKSLKDLMYQPDIKIDSNIYQYGRSLVEMVQVISGAMPSLFGGQLRGNETLGAYQQSRDQAMGKLQLFWAVVKQHHASTMRLAVECFRRNRTGDAEKVILGKSNDFVSKYIRLADLKGSIIAEPEADEDFPQTWNEIRANLNEMMTNNPDVAAVFLGEPANLTTYKKYLGTPNVVFAAEGNREKQFREIDELLMAAPIAVPDIMAMQQQAAMAQAPGGPEQADSAGPSQAEPDPMADPMAGPQDPMAPPQDPSMDPMMAAPMPIKYLPTVTPDVHVDDHLVHIKAIQEWAMDPDGGILAKKENPEGYANVLAHLLSHKEAQAQMMAFDATLTMQYGLAPPPGEEGSEGGDSQAKGKKTKPPSK